MEANFEGEVRPLKPREVSSTLTHPTSEILHLNLLLKCSIIDTYSEIKEYALAVATVKQKAKSHIV